MPSESSRETDIDTASNSDCVVHLAFFFVLFFIFSPSLPRKGQREKEVHFLDEFEGYTIVNRVSSVKGFVITTDFRLGIAFFFFFARLRAEALASGSKRFDTLLPRR